MTLRTLLVLLLLIGRGSATADEPHPEALRLTYANLMHMHDCLLEAVHDAPELHVRVWLRTGPAPMVLRAADDLKERALARIAVTRCGFASLLEVQRLRVRLEIAVADGMDARLLAGHPWAPWPSERARRLAALEQSQRKGKVDAATRLAWRQFLERVWDTSEGVLARDYQRRNHPREELDPAAALWRDEEWAKANAVPWLAETVANFVALARQPPLTKDEQRAVGQYTALLHAEFN